MKNSIEDWHRSSFNYAQDIGPRLTHDYARDLIEKLHLSSKLKILEIAAGTGQLTLELAKQADHVLATDISDNMLSVLRQRLIDNQTTNVTTAQMNAECLRLASSSFDRVACMFGIMLFNTPSLGIREIKRVLKPSGHVCASVWSTPKNFEMMQLFAHTIESLIPNQQTLDLTNNPAFSLSNANYLKRLFDDAKFSNISIVRTTHSKNFASVDELFSILTSGTPPLRWFTDFLNDDMYTNLRSAICHSCFRRYGNFPIQLRSEALVLSASA